MSSTDPIQTYGMWIAAALIVITFLFVWLRSRRAGRHLNDLTAPQIKLVERPAADPDDTPEIKHVRPSPEDLELAARWATLTQRQKQVALYVGDDHSDEDIALKMGITVHTVQSHLKEVRRKLGIRSRYQLQDIVRQVGSDPD